MPASILEIKERLVGVIDKNGKVRDMGIAAEAISVLERMAVTKEDLERTRLGLHVNNIRKAAKNSPLAKRAKNLVKSWRQMIEQESRQGPPVAQGRLRPETPNSVGSSPSPPEPNDYTVRSYSSRKTPVTVPPAPRSNTPIENTKKSKKHKDTFESSKTTRKKEIPDGPTIPKGQSSEAKPTDTGQLMSVAPNGLKLTFKTRPGGKESTNQNEEIDVVNIIKPAAIERAPIEKTSPSQKERKNRKRKKGHKSPHKTPSPASSATDSRLPRQDDIYNNNNKNEKRLVTSQSTPNFTVQKTIMMQHKSPDQSSSPNNAIIRTPKSCADLKSLASPGNSNLKRKRDQTVVLPTSPDGTGEKPRGPKERRLTLTYDPLTGQLQQTPSDKSVSDHQSSSPSSDRDTKKTQDKNATKITNIKNRNERDSVMKNLYKTESKVKNATFPTKIAEKVETTPKLKKIHKIYNVEEEVIENTGIPTRLSPSVQIMGEFSGATSTNCKGECLSNFYETRRQFRKRKTRRKDAGALETSVVFPISNLVEFTDSDSDENSSSKSNFCTSIKIDKREDTNESSAHSHKCNYPGVTGCRGSNGSWYNWMETICVNAHTKSGSLPEETEILPLTIFPYVELD